MLILITEAAHTQNKNDILYVSAKNGLRLRTEPGMESKTITTIPYDEQVTFIEKLKSPVIIDNKEGYWTKVKSGRNEGWVFGAYLRKDSESDFLTFVSDYLNNKHKNLYSDELKKYQDSNNDFMDYYNKITKIKPSDIRITDFTEDIYIVEAPSFNDLISIPDSKFYAFYYDKNHWATVTERKLELKMYDLNADGTLEIIEADGLSNSFGIIVYEKIDGKYIQSTPIGFLGNYKMYIDKFNALHLLIEDWSEENNMNGLYKYSPKEHKFIKTNDKER